MMEELLTVLLKDAQAPKFAPIRQSCQNTLDLLQDSLEMERMPTYLLREKCLEPLQLALESRTKRLVTHAVSGIEKLLKDERLHSSMETESESRWLPMQVLNTVYSVPNLPEDVQVDVMKLLLKMTFSSSLCMNARVITDVAQVYIDTYTSSTSSVRAVVQAALTQLLGNFTERLANAVKAMDSVQPDVMSEFNAKGDAGVESLTEDVVTLLSFLTEKVVAAHKAGQNRHAIPLLLEGIYAILTNAPGVLRANFSFQQLVWQNLCPTLISLLGIPRADVKQKTTTDHSVNVECPSLSPQTAKIIYCISVELAKMVGPVASLRPVLESLFHRILRCPQPTHRHDAIKTVKELLSIPHILCDITVTYSEDRGNTGKSSSPVNDLTLIKLIIDSIQECCHSTDSSLCYTCVSCINDLLTSLEHLARGVGIHSDSVAVIWNKYWKNKQRQTLSRTSQLVQNDSKPVDNGTPESQTHEAENISSDASQDNGEHQTSNTIDSAENLADAKDSEINVREEKGEIDEEEEKVEGKSVTRKLSCTERERESAQNFVKELASILPHLMTLTCVADVDEHLQKFSSAFSDDVILPNHSEDISEHASTILNGDSIYYTSYAALCLSLNLSQSGFYETRDKTLITFSERQFIDSILDSDMFLYLSPDWLASVYKTVLQSDLLHEAGWKDEEMTLVTALLDLDGQGNNEHGVHTLRDSVFDCQDEEQSAMDPKLVEAGKLLAHQILTQSWPAIMDVLSAMMSNSGASGVTNTFAIMLGIDGAKEEHLRKREALCACLDGLQKAAKLCCKLGLQERCAAVFAHLANTSCVMEDFKHATQVPVDRGGQKLPTKPKLVRLHAAHILSMDAMMTHGLEIGSHSPDCWKHVFRCCAFISELEHTYFSSGNNQSSLPKIQQEQQHDIQAGIDESADLYSVPIVPVVPVAPRINVSALIKQSSIESGWDRSNTGGGVLNAGQASQALCGLSQEVDRLFEEAASHLTLRSLTAFLSQLCEASKHQLYKISRQLMEDSDHSEYHPLPVNSLHLYRLTNVLLKVVHSDRPLIHLIKAWSVVSPYLVESAGHRDRSISKMSVTCVHDYIIAVMTNCVELKHFHTNEMLCKTFENILCLELCDGDVQDQIVCSICELVEASAADIRSGWRPLFGALRAVRIEYTTIEEVNEARQRHVEAVLDVFDVYLNTDNLLVFANAMVDCILCLLKYVRGQGEFEDSDTDDTDSVSDYMSSSPASENLVLPALQYLKQCSVILQSMWNMPACPIFHGAKRIQVETSSRCVDPNIPNMNFKKFARYFVSGEGEGHDLVGDDKSPKHRDTLGVTDDRSAGECTSITSIDSGIILNMCKDGHEKKTCDSQLVQGETESQSSALVSLGELDNQTGILHVWFLMLEGLSGALSACSRSYQPHTMETLFELLRSASHIPGPEFGVYCMKHLLFPMLQSWLRSGSRKFGYWDTAATNFKQCCGHAADLVVDMLSDFAGNQTVSSMLCSVLQQFLIVLTECVAQPFEVISRLGCSCIRHILLSGSPSFSPQMWQIVIDGLESALDVTTYCTRQLMLLFKANSENFYGDIGQVKVATRKDSSATDFFRMWNLAQQVFLLDSQVDMTPPQLDNEEDRSYVLLLYPPGYENSLNPDHILARLPFRSVVVGLLSHQLLLQTVGCILLEGSHSGDSHQSVILSRLSMHHVMQLLDCLRNSYKMACEFDLRPGLKFLLQKVAHTQVAVNLYKQAGASMVFYIHTLIKICSKSPGLNKETVRTLLLKEEEKVSKDKNESPNMKRSTKDGKDTGPVGDAGDNISNCGDKVNNADLHSHGADDIDKKSSLDDQAFYGAGDSFNDSIKPRQHEDANKDTSPPEPSSVKDVSESSQAKFGSATNNQAMIEHTADDQNNYTDKISTAKESSHVPLKMEEKNLFSSNSQVGVNNGFKIDTRIGVDFTKKSSADMRKSEIVADNVDMFVSLLLKVCNELCQTYIDILYDKEGTSCVDSMAAQQLFFLIAQPDDLPEVGRKKLDLDQLSSQLQQTQARLQGLAITQPVSVQNDETGSIASTANPIQEEKETKDPSALPPLSPSHKVEKSKRELRSEQESRVYNLATDKLIKNLMTEYKKRKNQNAMPNFAKQTKKDKKEKKVKKLSDPVEQAIDQQQQSSIMKDSEAHLQAWTELLCSILGLFQQLDDGQFTTLLPTVFSCVNQLVCHAQDMRLREELAQWLHRIGRLYQIAPIGAAKLG